MRSRRLPSVVPPPSPNQSAEVRLLLALVEAVERILDHNPYANPLVEDLFESGAYKTALKREEARRAGTFSAAERLMALLEPTNPLGLELNPLELLLGWWDVVDRVETEFHEGLAHLTPQEAKAWHLFAQGHEPAQIARFMDHTRSRRLAQLGGGISVEAVYKHLQRGRTKLETVLASVGV